MFVQISNDVCIAIIQKAGSSSMIEALSSIPTVVISAKDALTMPIRVAFVRHPIERINSLFNHFYWMALNNSTYSEFIPNGTITAFGARVDGHKGANEHHWGVDTLTLYFDTIAKLPTRTELDNADYQSFIDFILSGEPDSHWAPQYAQGLHEGVFVPNTVHRFEDVNKYWFDYVGGKLPTTNSWAPVAVDPYRLDDLYGYYADDLILWEACK